MSIHIQQPNAAGRASIAQIPKALTFWAKNFSRCDVGASLFHQGDVGTNAILLLKGTMCSYRVTKDGDRLINVFILGGEIFRHSARGIRMNSVKALSDCMFQRLSPDDLGVLRAAGTHRKQLNDLANEEWNMTSALLNRLHMSADQRVGHFILDIAQRSNAGIGNLPFKLDMSRSEIASYLGLTTETVVRSLKRLALGNMFTAITPHDYQIRNVRKLRELANI